MIESALLSGVRGISHGFGTRAENVPAPLREDWERKKPNWKQVHGAAFAQVKEFSQNCGEIDALWTNLIAAPIAVVSADCVPILLARRDGRRVAAVHAGWRGTRARILRELWLGLAARGERASEWVAAIGPAIGPCCYEVSEELARQFEKEFSFPTRGRMLDLPGINEKELRELGLHDVDLLRACTRCTRENDDPVSYRFHSYRREGGGTRQYSMIRIEALSGER